MKDWSSLFIVIQGVFLTAVPFILEKKLKINIPESIKIGIILFIFATLMLGEIQDFYSTFWWWDVALHTVAGYGLTLIAFIILSIIYKQSDLNSTAILTSIFAVSFALGVSVFWEIYEFAIDPFTKADMQPSLADTMWDLIVATLGSFLAVLSGWNYIRKNNVKDSAKDVIEEGVSGNK